MMELHDAELLTDDYKARHFTAEGKALGVWRWKGIQKHRERILAAVVGKRTIDFGGYDGPLGYGSVVVDPQADYKRLQDLPKHWWDTFFTSHTLEHVPDLGKLLVDVYHRILRPGGTLIAHVPAYTCTRWRPANYNNEGQSPHLRTFALTTDATPLSLMERMVDIPTPGWRADGWYGFRVDLAEHCGDDSIIVFATKPYPVPA